jgi:hypothetical protein
MANPKCEVCGKRGNFGLEKGKRPSRCKAHKTEGMFDVTRRPCGVDGCEKLPGFGMPGTRKALR